MRCKIFGCWNEAPHVHPELELERKPPTGGVKHDSDKNRWDLLPFDALDSVAEVLKYGAGKYADRNWEKGMTWGRQVDFDEMNDVEGSAFEELSKLLESKP